MSDLLEAHLLAGIHRVRGRFNLPSDVAMLTASLFIDLTGAKREAMRQRVAVLGDAPDGCRVIVLVGAVVSEPAAVRVLAEHEPRLFLDIRGTKYAANTWLRGIRENGRGVLL